MVFILEIIFNMIRLYIIRLLPHNCEVFNAGCLSFAHFSNSFCIHFLFKEKKRKETFKYVRKLHGAFIALNSWANL